MKAVENVETPRTHGAESSDRRPVVRITAEQLRDFDELRRFVAEGYRASGHRHSWVNRFKHGDRPLAFGFGRTIVSREKRVNSAGRQQEQVVLRIGVVR